jgi:dTDP-4-dehydrorhamnose reductase
MRALDASDRDAVVRLIADLRPDVIFFPAANPNVDWCEREPAEAERENLDPLRATLAAAGDVRVIAYSSDYVFDGRSGPYTETDAVAPLSVYGRIKVELERLVLAAGGTVIRTTGVFGWEPPPARNFVLRIAASLARGERARVPNDQIANPTYADDLAAASIEVARDGGTGIWHIGGAELLARDAFARLVAEAFDADPTLVEGVPTSELGQAARRPLRGGLRCIRYRERFGAAPVRPVRGALAALRAKVALPA